MISKSLPFHNEDRKQTFKLIKEAQPDISGTLWNKISAPCKDLLLQMLVKKPKERITIDEALQHPAFVQQGLTNKVVNKNISVEEVGNEFDKQLKQQQALSRQ